MISKKSLKFSLFVLIVVGVSMVVFFYKTPKKIANEFLELPGCKVAFSPEIYSNFVNIKEESKNLLRHYRKSWQDVCLGTSPTSLYPLWVEALELKKEFSLDIIFNGISDNGLDNYINEQLPSFVPGFSGSIVEYEYFRPDPDLFADNLALGNQEDKDFFTIYFSLNPSPVYAPWLKGTYDYDQCIDYNNYDWTGTLKSIDGLSKKIKGPVYVETINSFKNDLMDAFNSKIEDRCTKS